MTNGALSLDSILALHIQGKSDAEIARQLGSTRQNVRQTRLRHKDVVAPIVAAAEKAVADYLIAQKLERLAAKNDRWLRARKLIDVRAGDDRYAGEPGWDTGLMVHKLKALGSGDGMVIVDEFAVDTGLLAEMRALEDSAADELGQKPKAATVDLSDRRTYVLQLVKADGHDVALG